MKEKYQTKNSTERVMKILTLEDIQNGEKYSNNVALQLPTRSRPIDIGSLSYLKRIRQSNKWKHAVNIASLDKVRLKRLSAWIDCVCLQKMYGRRDRTIEAQLMSAIRFIYYSEINGCENILESKKTSRTAYSKYTNYLNSRLRENTLSQSAAGQEQRYAAFLIESSFSVPTTAVLKGLPVIKKHSIKSPETEVKEVGQVLENINLLVSVFDSIFEFIIKNNKYPAELSIGGAQRWIFPHGQWVLNSSGLKRKDCSRAIDFENGKIHEFEVVRHEYSTTQSAKSAIEAAKAQIVEANHDLKHPFRIRLAMQAHDAFVLLFIAVTGINLAGIRDLSWGKDYCIEKTSITIRTIKYRADGKQCSFKIEAKFLPYMRKYLKLRKFITGDVQVKWLFFSLKHKDQSTFIQISDSFSWNTADRFKKEINHNCSIIGARDWRAYKADYYLNTTDILTTAKELQNTERTVRKYYANGSFKSAKKEMTEFFNNGLPLKKREVVSIKEIPVGGCGNYGYPITVSSQIKNADCSAWEGCLGCENYAYHADATDVRKLLSAKEVVLSTKHLSTSKSEFEKYFDYFLNRISEIVVNISSLSEKHLEMVRDVSIDVSKGNYDEYWMAKHEMLMNIGVIND